MRLRIFYIHLILISVGFCLAVKATAQNKNIKPSFGYETLDTTLSAHDSLWQAQLYITQSIPDKGIPILLSLIKTSQTGSDFNTFCKIYLSEAYRQKHEQRKGLDILIDLLHIKKSNKNRALLYNRMAALYSVSNQKVTPSREDSVYKYSNLCIEIAKQYNYLDLLASSQNELGYYYKNTLHNDSLALVYCNSAFNTFLNLKMNQNASYTAFNISSIYLSMDKPEKAAEVLSTVETVLDPNINKNLFMYIYEKKAKINFLLKDYKKAYQYINKAYYYEKSFFSSKLDRQVSEMTAKYDLQEKEKLIKEEQQQSRIKQQQNNLLLTTIIFITILLMLVTVLYYYKRKIIRIDNLTLQNKLNSKSNELVTNIANMVNLNKIFSEIKSALDANDSDKIKSIINQNVQTNQSWNSFLQSFESLYPDFFNNLKLSHTGLTKSELKLSALLLMNLTTPEIADILCISPTSVSKNRNRLRKKLNLEAGHNLNQFMIKISKL